MLEAKRRELQERKDYQCQMLQREQGELTGLLNLAECQTERIFYK